MAKIPTKKRGPYKVSQKRIDANRRNSMRSTGPRSREGRAASSMNNCSHGMRSTQKVLPGESQELFDDLEKELTECINPRTPLEKLMADRVILQSWKAKRGDAAADSNATKAINAAIEGPQERDTAKAEALVGVLNQDRTAARKLRGFPAGVTYLLNQWTIIQLLIKNTPNLLASQRKRCLALLGKRREDVLADCPVATRWVRLQMSALYGTSATRQTKGH